MIKNHGLNIKLEDITPDQYTFGSGELEAKLSGLEILQPNRNWQPYLPHHETQHNKNLDTNACYIYGCLEQLEIMLNRVAENDKDRNYAERFIAWFVEHNFTGGNPHTSLEKIRKGGVIDEELLPFTANTTREEYMVDKMPADLIVEGSRFLNKWKVNHDWLFLPYDSGKAETIWKQLQYCPVGVSVLAWQKGKTYYTKPKGATDTHWCVVIGGEYGKYFTVVDTYDQHIKKLEWDYDFNFGKRMIITPIIHQDNWLVDFIKRLFNLFK